MDIIVDYKKISKKINKIYKKYSKSISLDDLRKLIIKEFGSISFQIDNKNLLYLIVDYCPDEFDPAYLLIDLMEIGVSPNFVNEDGEKFIQFYCRQVSPKLVFEHINEIKKHIDANHRDINGKTIMHTLLMLNNNDLDDVFYNGDASVARYYYIETLEELIKLGFTEIGPCDGSEYDIFELLEQKLIELAKLDHPKVDPSDVYNKRIINIKENFYLKNPELFTNMLTDDIEENKRIYYKEFKDNTNLLNSDILIKLQSVRTSENEGIIATKRLIDLGCDVNAISGSMNDVGCYINGNLIDAAINFGRSGKYINELVELSLKNGLDLDSMLQSPIITMLGRSLYNINDIATVYSWLSMYGYNNLSDDVNVYSKPYEKYNVNSNEELIYLIRKESFCSMFPTLLLNSELSIPNLSDDNFVPLILDAVDSLNKLDNSYNDFKVYQKIIENLYNDRNNNIILNNKVTKKDIVNELKNVFAEILNNRFNKTLVKRGE